MSDFAIRVDGLSKKYRIGGRQASYRTLRETLVDLVRAPARRLKSVLRGAGSIPSTETIWALKDVSFEVKRGEVVGIIGRNGAGKTTLLKILSRITKPTEGTVDLYGRVGSLLEVGTGFHPELTGRENIFLNGAILGMRRREIERKFDEIVGFAEVEKFLDTPVKRYSSGMYVRLAFAVAAHLEPEILLVDEVLAVGDAQFQKKCLGKMKDVSYEGRTVLFVSHNMSAINQLCKNALLLKDGQIVQNGPAQEVVVDYLTFDSIKISGDVDVSDPSWRVQPYSSDDSRFKWTRITLINSADHVTPDVRFGEPFEFILEGVASEPLGSMQATVGVHTVTGIVLFNSWGEDDIHLTNLPAGRIRYRVKIMPNYLAPGEYELHIGAGGAQIQDVVGPFRFSVLTVPFNNQRVWKSNHRGIVANPCTWLFEGGSGEGIG